MRKAAVGRKKKCDLVGYEELKRREDIVLFDPNRPVPLVKLDLPKPDLGGQLDPFASGTAFSGGKQVANVVVIRRRGEGSRRCRAIQASLATRLPQLVRTEQKRLPKRPIRSRPLGKMTIRSVRQTGRQDAPDWQTPQANPSRRQSVR